MKSPTFFTVLINLKLEISITDNFKIKIFPVVTAF